MGGVRWRRFNCISKFKSTVKQKVLEIKSGLTCKTGLSLVVSSQLLWPAMCVAVHSG